MDLKLHDGQIEALYSTERFKILACGRRWGKTHLAWVAMLTYMLEHPTCLVWWVAPYYKELIPASRKIREITPNNLIAKKLEQQEVIRYLRLVNGSECWFHSADKEDSLRGSGLHGLVVDEAGQMRKSRWDNELRPSLTDYKGWTIFISTPKGMNWFHQFYTRGQDNEQKDWKSWKHKSEENPFLDPQEILDAKRDLPALVFKQEYEAEFLEDIGAVFRKVDRHIQDITQGVIQGNKYVVGADLAKYEDYTVLVAIDSDTGHVHGFDRFQQLDWVFQRKRIVSFCKRYNNARLLMDSTGVGDAVYDELKRYTVRVRGFKFTNASKADLIENLSVMLDNDKIKYPDIPVLINELKMFGYDMLPSGTIRYRAPEGYHDDCVYALALAAWQIGMKRSYGARFVNR